MKYGLDESGPLVVTDQPLMLRWYWSAVASQNAGVGRVMVLLGNGSGRDQTGDLGRDGGRRVSALLLPALGTGGRPVTDQVVGRVLDVRPQRVVAAQFRTAGAIRIG